LSPAKNIIIFYCMTMQNQDAKQFWQRYKDSAVRDFFVVLKAKISPSTLSTWKSKNIYPRADAAVEIASIINTSVEYLVTGKEPVNAACSSDALEIASAADHLTEEGIDLLKNFVSSLKDTHSRNS